MQREGNIIMEDNFSNAKNTNSKKTKIIVIVVSVVLIFYLLISLMLGIFFGHSRDYRAVSQVDYISTNTTGLVQAGTTSKSNRSLYDKDGNRLLLKGINVGNLLLQEGWMSPFALEPMKNDDGSYAKDKDGNILYPEFYEEQFLTAIYNNPNLKDNAEELIDYYRACFMSDIDFKIIKEDMNFNVIRLPFYWRNILNDDLTLKEESKAFAYLDWFLEKCKENDLYCILDLHGAPGSQNSIEHSGAMPPQPGLWHNEKNENAVINLWDFVSSYYTNVRNDLAPYIVTYDILNEPLEKADGYSTEYIADFYDKVYQAIRENNDRHVITFEFVWDDSKAVNPAEYGWENVMYQNHHYNWDSVNIDVYKAYFDFFKIGHDYDVPYLVGEFTYFTDDDMWETALDDWYDAYGYNWTMWNYKTAVVGWWDSSWGYQVARLNLDVASEETKCNVATCTEEEFRLACDAMKTENCQTGYLKKTIDAYWERFQKQ